MQVLNLLEEGAKVLFPLRLPRPLRNQQRAQHHQLPHLPVLDQEGRQVRLNLLQVTRPGNKLFVSLETNF